MGVFEMDAYRRRVFPPMARVLVVDPEALLREHLSLRCAEAHSILWARTAARGLTLVRLESVDLVLLEYRLPDGSGLGLLREIKRLEPRLPVMVVTAYGSEQVCATALKLGARDYFIKPYDLTDLLASVRALATVRTQSWERRDNAIGMQPTGLERPGTAAARAAPPAVLVEEAVRFIQEHYWDSVLLASIARQLKTSPFALSRAFRRIKGICFRRYLVQFRIAKAQDLLHRSSYPITEVAQLVGFGDLPRFDKVFKQMVGTSPSRYRAGARATSDKPAARNY